ncbi:MAG: hypothetical protein J0H65_04840 [Rhizobiales bacterium]|nr:hypothetical protein [Hyphomicrobiales bacterium]
MDIDVKELTTYRISEDGQTVTLRFRDGAGVETSLRVPVAALGNLVMTLPGIIEAALQRQFGDASFRYAYPVGSWSVEEAVDPGAVIVTMRTVDGFGVSFSMGRGNAEKLGHSMADWVASPRMATAH